jgi:hypothetical protein
MAKYFNYFPKVPYFLNDENTSLEVVTNLTTKFKFDNTFKENSVVYYDYIVKDGETPEIIADKLYGSSERHWIILLINDIVHPQLDWPIEQNSLIKLIDNKYESFADVANNQTGLQWSQSNIKEYYVTEEIKNLSDNSTTISINQITPAVYANTTNTVENYTLSSNVFVTVSKTKSTKTYYDYEIENNESKRNIKLLKNEFIPTIEEEFKNLFR